MPNHDKTTYNPSQISYGGRKNLYRDTMLFGKTTIFPSHKKFIYHKEVEIEQVTNKSKVYSKDPSHKPYEQPTWSKITRIIRRFSLAGS